MMIVPTGFNKDNPTRQALVREFKTADASVQMWWRNWKATDRDDTVERDRTKSLAKQWEDRRKQRRKMLETYDYYEWEQEKERRIGD